jgi:heat-inducible transcriptional repressor
VIVRGRANLINDTMASDELSVMQQLFDELESKDGLIELLGDAETAQGVKIFIGSENKLFSLSGSSVILSAPTRTPMRRWSACLGVIGPTRLNYARIVPVVDYTANVITAMMARKG